jgi:hypothetical protein
MGTITQHHLARTLGRQTRGLGSTSQAESVADSSTPPFVSALPWTGAELQFPSIQHAQRAMADPNFLESAPSEFSAQPPPRTSPPRSISHNSAFSFAASSASAHYRLNNPGGSPLALGGLSRRPSMQQLASGLIPWSKERQTLFEWHLIRITASNNFSFSWVQNWRWKAFVGEFLPQAKVISRKVLAGRVLDSALKEIQSEAKERAFGKLVTIQTDGWSGGNLRHFQAFMMSGGREVSLMNLI